MKIANYEIIKRRPKDQGHYEIALGYHKRDDSYATWERNCRNDEMSVSVSGKTSVSESWYHGHYDLTAGEALEDFYTR